MRAASSSIHKHSNTYAICMQLFSEQLNKTTVWKWRLQSIVNVSSGLYKGLTSTVLWMNYSNLHLIWNKKMVSLLYKFLQACYSNGSHFMSVLKIIQRSPGSHDKVMYMNFFILPVILTKFESKVAVHGRAWNIKSGPHFVFRL